MNLIARIRWVMIALAAMLHTGAVTAQTMSQLCFGHLYAVAHADTSASLQRSLAAFVSAGCDTPVLETSKSLTQSSAPSVDGAAYLAYIQSVSRLAAMRTGQPRIVVSPAVKPGITGGDVTTRVEFLLVDAAGKTVKAAAPAHLFSKDLLESLRNPELSKELLISPVRPAITKAGG
jgi:hypothetical protein